MDTIDVGPTTRTLAGLVREVRDDQLDNRARPGLDSHAFVNAS